jgi:hypothetical protein
MGTCVPRLQYSGRDLGRVCVERNTDIAGVIVGEDVILARPDTGQRPFGALARRGVTRGSEIEDGSRAAAWTLAAPALSRAST